MYVEYVCMYVCMYVLCAIKEAIKQLCIICMHYLT